LGKRTFRISKILKTKKPKIWLSWVFLLLCGYEKKYNRNYSFNCSNNFEFYWH
jgi:hypothetical protein